ncbi:hypothetical protein GPALN_003058 [Globodera pallida]|nr:hypothetical protein GPALN_003058 [Globodera pallida]
MFRIQAQVQVARRQRPKQQTVEAARRETAPASESHKKSSAINANGHKNRQFERIGKNIKLYKRLPKAPRGPPKHPERDERWRKKRYKNHNADDIGGGGRPSLRLGQRRGSSYLYVNKKNKMRARTRPREREAVTERAAAARKWEQLKDRLEVERKIARAQRKRRRLDYTESKRPAAAATTKRRRNSVSIRKGGRRLRPIDQQEQQQHTFSSSADSDDDNYSDELAWGREAEDGRINNGMARDEKDQRNAAAAAAAIWRRRDRNSLASSTVRWTTSSTSADSRRQTQLKNKSVAKMKTDGTESKKKQTKTKYYASGREASKIGRK